MVYEELEQARKEKEGIALDDNVSYSGAVYNKIDID